MYGGKRDNKPDWGRSVDYDYNLHAASPFHDLVLVACNLESLAALAVPNDRDVGQPVRCLKSVELLVFLLVAVGCIPCVHEINHAMHGSESRMPYLIWVLGYASQNRSE